MSTKEELSLTLYHYLSRIIGAEDIVKTRQNIFKVMDFVMNDNDGFTFISSGSKAEGIDLKGSDFDRMIVLKMVHVYESFHYATYAANRIFILLDHTDTPSGFTKLKLYDNLPKCIPVIGQCSQTLGQETYISSKLFREYFLSDNMIIHGPCQSLPGDVYDRVVCFRCKPWIALAQPWINRSQSTWPDYEQKFYNIREQNKSVYKQFDITFSCYRFGLYCDALSYWLLLASFMYQHKRFKECIDIVIYCLSKSTLDKIFLQATNSLEEQTLYEKTKRVVGLLVTCKYLIIKNMFLSLHFIYCQQNCQHHQTTQKPS
ncbi:unnamed protein product [Mytilus edulis]|uniref:Uncharacterized protein n=1 Tax=Mytilus edulis TaxID=6550 RepID=A0A8S3TN29_MYTED|nr:unnamed protein product [Mytilus edulis]